MRARKTLRALVPALVALGLALSACGGADDGGAIPEPTDTAPTGTQVKVVDIAFEPAEVTITVGETVTWVDTGDLPHSVTADDKSFDSHPDCPSGACMKKGEAYSFTFNTAGKFGYMCRVHGNQQRGTVTVTA